MTPAGATGASRDAATGEAAVAALAELINGARSVVALTGAGISVPSGIPDFRTPRTGLWSGVDPMEVAHIDVFHRDPERFWRFYGDRFATLGDREPNPAHAVLVAMERAGRLDAVITQNIDQLHAKAGSGAYGGELIEVHGTVARCSCLSCGVGGIGLAETRARIAGSPEGIPRCAVCAAPLKPDVVLFGEYLPEAALRRAEALAAGADLLLCIGSSLEVWPVAQLPAVTLAAGGAVALVTAGGTPLDARASVKLSGDVVAELTTLAAALGLTV